MAIHVLKRHKQEITCKTCKSELAYEYSDIQDIKAYSDYLGDYSIIRGIVCPVCTHPVKV